MTLPVVPFPLNPPSRDIDTQRAWTHLRTLLNRPHRNEWCVAVPCVDSTFNVTTLPAQGQATMCGSAPYLDGLVLRRVRVVKAASLSRTTGNSASFQIRALLGTTTGAIEVGTFDTRTAALTARQPRLISSSTAIDRAVPAGAVFEVEVTQIVFPKLSVKDVTVLFDLSVT